MPNELLSTLEIKAAKAQEAVDGRDITERTEHIPTKSPQSKEGAGCTMCGQTFDNYQEQRRHVRSDLHNYNLKQKVRGTKPVTEDEFEKLMGGMCYHLCIDAI